MKVCFCNTKYKITINEIVNSGCEYYRRQQYIRPLKTCQSCALHCDTPGN